jgi:type VI secretion system secreted protein Hcp
VKRRIAIGTALVAVLAAAATTYALAASGASTTQTINACVNHEGQMRLVAVAGACRGNETALSWNTVGPAGAQGAQGVQGAAGQPGAAGPAGPQGEPPPDPDSVAATVMVTGQKQGQFSQAPIEVTAISHEIVSPRDPASGLPTGKRQHKPIVITTEWGASTPLFLNALTQNENLTSVLIGLLRDGKQVATIQLTNASISQFDQHGENVTLQFTYQKITWTWVDGGITAQDDWEAPIS